MAKQLVFDTTSADTILDSDSVGAFLRSSDGTLITHTAVGGKQALDVRLAEGVNVEVDLSHVDDSVRLGDGTDFFTSTSENGDVALDVHISNTSIEVTATDLDIRPLTNADVVTVEQGTDPWVIGDGGGSITVDGTVGISGDVNVTQGTSPWVVSATDLDIRDLSAAQDSVASHLFDGAGTALTSTLIGADQALDVNVVQNVPGKLDTAILSSVATLTASGTAETVVSSPLANRGELRIFNNDNRSMYIGGSGVTVNNGYPLAPKDQIVLEIGPSTAVYFDSDKTGHEIRTLERS